MIASAAKLLDFLNKSPGFVIPIYQRTYSWTEKECRQLWDDIIRAGSSNKIKVHFIGSVIYIQEGLSQVTLRAPLLVIDGQQRLTTATLLIAALAESLGDKEPVSDFTARKLRNYYLLNPEESGERKYKLVLSQTDKATLFSIVQNQKIPREHSLRIVKNYRLFKDLLAARQKDIASICRGLAKLVIVDTALTWDQDNPQLIFESMNSTGLELSQADLIRNFILMNLEQQRQTEIYEQLWHPMETLFGQEAYDTDFNKFMRHYLTVRTGEIPRLSDVYEAFKKHARSPENAKSGAEALTRDLLNFAEFYCAMALDKETDPDLSSAFRDLRELKVDVAYPFLLEMYRDYDDGVLEKNDFIEAVRLIEAYVFRRAVCEVPTNSLNKTFATFARGLDKNRYMESIRAHFLLMASYRRFPDDDEFKRKLQTRDLYNFRSRSYWLRRFENHGRKEHVPVNEYTIEHIMPQNERLSSDWRTSLGDDWERIHHTYLHTLGNLTLTGYNSEYSNRSFKEKRNMEGGFRHSPLKVNTGLAELETWNEASIKLRAVKLAEKAVEIWRAPSVPSEVLEGYKPSEANTTEYSIKDHPNLSNSRTRELFEAFRKEVLALDPCVAEEFRKKYIAYKAETNFVYLHPRADLLQLNLLIGFSDIYDPKKLCKDIPLSKGHHVRSREIQVNFRKIDQLSYMIGLVRQSLEFQLGSSTD